MSLMRVTPDWKSGYYWLAMLAYIIIWYVALAIFQPDGYVGRIGVWLPCIAVFYWLTTLARHAQLEADWELPKTPRIDINE